LIAHPDDTRVYGVDLGELGWITVQNNSTDNLHPNDTGAAILAELIQNALTPLAIKNLT
jgi:lysophospholipase L1-like esterase